jgi:hypothetical protein
MREGRRVCRVCADASVDVAGHHRESKCATRIRKFYFRSLMFSVLSEGGGGE